MNDQDEQPSGYIDIEDELTEEQVAELTRIWIECITADAILLLPAGHVHRDRPGRTMPKD